MPRSIALLGGALLGLLAGGLWWWIWGCRVCAPGSSPVGPVLFAALFGAAAGPLLAPRRDADGRLY